MIGYSPSRRGLALLVLLILLAGCCYLLLRPRYEQPDRVGSQTIQAGLLRYKDAAAAAASHGQLLHKAVSADANARQRVLDHRLSALSLSLRSYAAPYTCDPWALPALARISLCRGNEAQDPFRIFLDTNDPIDNLYFQQPCLAYKAELVTAVLSWLELKKLYSYANHLPVANHISLDIGARQSAFSILLARSGNTVHAFEPESSRYQLLRCSAHANGLDTLLINGFGLAQRPNARCPSSDSEDHCKNPNFFWTLDEYVRSTLKSKTTIFAARISAQGREQDVIAGARDTFRHHTKAPKVVILEFSPRAYRNFGQDPLEALSFLLSSNYRGFFAPWNRNIAQLANSEIFIDDLHLTMPKIVDVGSCDLIFIQSSWYDDVKTFLATNLLREAFPDVKLVNGTLLGSLGKGGLPELLTS